jgi:hypothetical protein
VGTILPAMAKKTKTARSLAKLGKAIAGPVEAVAGEIGKIYSEAEKRIHPIRKHLFRLISNPLPHPSAEEGESLAIPSYSQADSYSCGAIAGWMVLEALQPDAKFKDFYRLCSPTPENGLNDRELVKALRASGVGISTKKNGMTFADIKKTIGDGFPIITVVDCPGTENAHWVVIYGYSQKRKSKQQLVYLGGSNFMGLHTEHHGGPNPIPFSEYSRLSKGFAAYVCWGKA